MDDDEEKKIGPITGNVHHQAAFRTTGGASAAGELLGNTSNSTNISSTTSTTTVTTSTTAPPSSSNGPKHIQVDPLTGAIRLMAPPCGKFSGVNIIAKLPTNDSISLMGDAFNIRVIAAPAMSVSWGGAAPPPGVVNSSATYDFIPSDPVIKVGTDQAGESTIIYRLAGGESKLPPGLRLNVGTGQIYGTPNTSGVYHADILAQDLDMDGSNIVKVRHDAADNSYSVTIAVEECTGEDTCYGHGKCDPKGDLYDGNFACLCRFGYSGGRCEHSVLSYYIIAIVVALAGIPAAVYVHRLRKRALAPVDFEAKLRALVDAGEIEVPADDHPREVKRSCLTLVERLGKGAFGEVWKGVLDELGAGGGFAIPGGYLVAAKTVLAGASDDATEELLQEAIVMCQVGTHENLASIIGTVTVGTPLILIVSFCEHGSFLDVIKQHLKHGSGGHPTHQHQQPALPTKTKLGIAAGIANGMAHLISKRFVHRDLAARNCLVATGMVAKVADFGLSRSGVSNTGSEYYKSQAGVFPIRWTAPEAMATMKFSASSDVWSFGVVLLEAFTDGVKPYSKWKTGVIMEKLMSGVRAPQPERCPDDVYALMLHCWDTNPGNRPSFEELVGTAGALAAASGGAPAEEAVNSPQHAYAWSAGGGGGGGGAAGYLKSLVLTSGSSATDLTEYQMAMYQRVVSTEADESDESSITYLWSVLLATPLGSLQEAATLATVHCNADLQNEVAAAFAFAAALLGSPRVGQIYAALGLTDVDVAVVHLYTQETALYPGMNGALGGWGADGTRGIPHYAPFIKLLLNAMAKLPPVGNAEVFRGVRDTPLDVLLKGKGVGDTLVWGAFTSTSLDADTLQDPAFFGVGPGLGDRVIFHIKVQTGVQIQELSNSGSLFGYADGDEVEVLLRPGTSFVIDAITSLGDGVIKVQMHEKVSQQQQQQMAAVLSQLPPAPVLAKGPPASAQQSAAPGATNLGLFPASTNDVQLVSMGSHAANYVTGMQFNPSGGGGSGGGGSGGSDDEMETALL